MSECPICLELLTDNLIKTICGHEFHSSCFLSNAVQNGFNCPCCRNKLVEMPDNNQDYRENIYVYESDSEEEEETVLPTSEYILKVLQEKNITKMDLLKIVLLMNEIPHLDNNDEMNIQTHVKVDNIIYAVVDNYEEIEKENNEKKMMETEDKLIIEKEYRLVDDIETILDMRVY